MLISENQKKILNALSDGQFHSGTELADLLGISRSAICKQLNNLSNLGIEFTAITGKGYCLKQALQLLSEPQITQQLTPEVGALISQLEIHDCIHSTNGYLMDYEYSKSGIVCFAEYQSAGKGRRGRDWVSPFGSNIYLSILWQFQNGPAAISGLSLAVGVAVIRALNDCGVTGVGLKWPNDIYWQDRKLAGILIEVSGEASGPCKAVVGLGLNLYIPDEEAKGITQDWVDLKQIIGSDYEKIRNTLSASLLNQLMPIISGFEHNTFAHYVDEWRRYDCMKGKQVAIFVGKQVFKGCVKGINDDGLLLLEDEHGRVKPFASGEVSFHRS